MTNSRQDYPKLPAEVLGLLGLSEDDSVYVAKGSVNKITTPDGPVWLKIVEQAKTTRFRNILRWFLNLLPVPLLARTDYGKTGDTLLHQAEQADILRAAGFNTPETVFVNRDFYISRHSGDTLFDLKEKLKHASPEDRKQHEDRFESVLLKTTEELARLHQFGFAHGRPKMRDFAWNDAKEAIFIFDLEERPWEIMPMADAQARDIILWLVDLCQYPQSEPYADRVCKIIFETISEETMTSLRKIVRLVSPLAPGTRFLQKTTFKVREMAGGIAAYDHLKHHLSQPSKTN